MIPLFSKSMKRSFFVVIITRIMLQRIVTSYTSSSPSLLVSIHSCRRSCQEFDKTSSFSISLHCSLPSSSTRYIYILRISEDLIMGVQLLHLLGCNHHFLTARHSDDWRLDDTVRLFFYSSPPPLPLPLLVQSDWQEDIVLVKLYIGTCLLRWEY